jgi:hypothetical protein
MLLFTFVVSIIAGLACGVAPALRESRPREQATLRESPVASGAGRGARTQGALVTAEIALALPLLVGGGLLIHSFLKLSTIDPGYNPAYSPCYAGLKPCATPTRPTRPTRPYCGGAEGALDSTPMAL